jgi:hypothetical protein
MKKKFFIIIVIIICNILASCNSTVKVSQDNEIAYQEIKEKLEQKDKYIEHAEKQIKNLKNEQANLRNDIENLNNKLIISSNKNLELENRVKELRKQGVNAGNGTEDTAMQLWVYQSIYQDYRTYINLTLNEKTDTIDEKFTINGVSIGDNYKDVIKNYGDSYKETLHCNEAMYSSNCSFMKWQYPDGTNIIFDPIFVHSIVIDSIKYDTNFNIKVGDYALEALEYCNDTFEKYYSQHYNEPLLGWYRTQSGNVLILYFNKQNNRVQYGLNITDQTRVEKIELSIDSFD